MWIDVEVKPAYQVNELGQVRNKKRGKLLTPYAVGIAGYLQVKLYGEGSKKAYYVQVLVATAFHENPDNLPQVNHMDEIITNNKADNLEWCTAEYNVGYSKAIDHYFINPEGEPVTIHNLAAFCREFNLQRTTMHSVLSGARNSHKGWRKDVGFS